MSDPNNTPPPPPPENNPYPERPPIFDNPDAPEYQEAEAAASPPPPPQGAPAGGVPTKDERNWGMFAHLSIIVSGILGGTMSSIPLIGLLGPFIIFLGPLVIYLMKKDESSFIADQAKEALNFAISISVIFMGLALFSLLIITMIITIPLMFILGIVSLILIVIATIKTSEGISYRYPYIVRFIN